VASCFRADQRKKEFVDYLREEILPPYEQPFMAAVAALPRQSKAVRAGS
jgi:hypothetical protein